MADIEVNAYRNECPSCQRIARVGAAFCSHCGQKFHADITSPHMGVQEPSVSSFALHWRDIKIVGWLFGLLLFNSLVLGLVSHVNHTPWPTVVSTAVDAVIVSIFCMVQYRGVLPLFTLPKLNARLAIELLGVAVGFVVVVSVYFAFIQRAGVPLVRLTADYKKSGWPVWSMFILMSVMPAIFEEMAFRGVIQSSLERVLGSKEAWLIQAALFSVMHLLPINFPSHFVMGLCFGYMRLRTKSLYPGMMLHGAWNALVLCEEIYWSQIF